MSAINLQHATCCLSDGISQPPGPCSTIPSYHLARTIAPLQFVNCHYSGFNFFNRWTTHHEHIVLLSWSCLMRYDPCFLYSSILSPLFIFWTKRHGNTDLECGLVFPNFFQKSWFELMIWLKYRKTTSPHLKKIVSKSYKYLTFKPCRVVTRLSLGAGGLRFKFRAVQIGHTAAVAVTFRKKLCCRGVMMRRWAPHTRYVLRRDTASVAKVSQRKKIFKSASYASIRPMVGKRRIKFLNT